MGEVLGVKTPANQTLELAKIALVERTYADAQLVLYAESVEHFCRVWAETGQAILLRRNQRK